MMRKRKSEYSGGKACWGMLQLGVEICARQSEGYYEKLAGY
jgi:hypothetical protein